MRGSRLRTPIISGIAGPPAPEDSEDAVTRLIQNWIDAGTNRAYRPSFSTWNRLDVANSPALNSRGASAPVAPCPLLPFQVSGHLVPGTSTVADNPQLNLYRAVLERAARGDIVRVQPESGARAVRGPTLLHVTVEVPSPGTNLFGLWEFRNEVLTSLRSTPDPTSDLCRFTSLSVEDVPRIDDEAALSALTAYRSVREVVDYAEGLSSSSLLQHRFAWSVYQ